MTMSPFTLAALASAAVEDQSFVRTNLFTTGTIGDFDSALLETDQGQHYLIRVPTNPGAQADLEADLRAINSMSAGIRSRMSFAVPKAIGHVDHEPHDGLVLSFAPGVPVSISSIGEGTGHADSLGMAIAGIHNLPTDFVDDYGLPNFNAGAVRDEVTNIVDRAGYDAKVQLPLITRWSQAIADDELWEFESTVVHGDLSEDVVLFTRSEVTGIIGWRNLAISDPAQDLGWAITALPHSSTLLSAYTTRRAGEADRFIENRARLHGELALAKWLMFGIEQDDETIIADARALLDDLTSKVENNLVPKLVTSSVAASAVNIDMDLESDSPAGGITGQVSGIITEKISPAQLLSAQLPDAVLATTDAEDTVDAEIDDDEPADGSAYESAGEDVEEIVDVEAIETHLELPTEALDDFEIEPAKPSEQRSGE